VHELAQILAKARSNIDDLRRMICVAAATAAFVAFEAREKGAVVGVTGEAQGKKPELPNTWKGKDRPCCISLCASQIFVSECP
jgi:hypothetical protein